MDILEQLNEKRENQHKLTLADLEALFGSLDLGKRSRKFDQRHILLKSRHKFAISSKTLRANQKQFKDQFFLIIFDWQEPERLFCIPYSAFESDIQKAKIGYGTAPYNRNSYEFWFNKDNTCNWGGVQLDTSSFLFPHDDKLLSDLSKTISDRTREPAGSPSIEFGPLVDLEDPIKKEQLEAFLTSSDTFTFDVPNQYKLEEEGYILFVVKGRSEVFVGNYNSNKTDDGFNLEFSTLGPTKYDRISLNTWNQKLIGSSVEFNDGNLVKFIAKDIFDELVEKYGAETIGIQKELNWQELNLGELIYSDEEALKKQISAIINSGHNLLITGPPGVGKTVLAEKIGEAAQREGLCTGILTITGTSDWSSFETIGGLMPVDSDEDIGPSENFTLRFVEGVFLQAIRENRWLIIDEINRCDIDKIFGPLFTVFSNNRVELPYKKNKRPITISPNFSNEISSYDKENLTYEIGKNWRIIGTMNEADKSSLYDLSFAFMRRFAFLKVSNPSYETIINILKTKGGEDFSIDFIKQIAKLATLESRNIGIAILISVLDYLKYRGTTLESLKEAINAFIEPQLEGLTPQEKNKSQLIIREVLNSVENFVNIS